MEQEIVEKSFEPVVSTENADMKNQEPVEGSTLKEPKEILHVPHDSINTEKDVQKMSYASIVSTLLLFWLLAKHLITFLILASLKTFCSMICFVRS